MTCQCSHMELGETYDMRVNARCANCGWSFRMTAKMVYAGHHNVTVFDGHTYYGDCFNETPPVHCPNCQHSTGKFSMPCSEGLGDELFKARAEPVDAIARGQDEHTASRR